jgi:hypothetical protein
VFRHDLRSIQIGHDKLIWASDGGREFYELDDAYREGSETSKQSAEIAAQMERQLGAIVEARRPGGGKSQDVVAIDESARERLRALGYLH